MIQELKLQELQDSLEKVARAILKNLSPAMKAFIDEPKKVADAVWRCEHMKPDNSTTAQLCEAPHQLLADAETSHDGVISAEQMSSSIALPAVDKSVATLLSALSDIVRVRQ
ncbi:MAG: hypothetical protein ACSLEL_00400 [Candidatus Malihini olakiniferum]